MVAVGLSAMAHQHRTGVTGRTIWVWEATITGLWVRRCAAVRACCVYASLAPPYFGGLRGHFVLLVLAVCTCACARVGGRHQRHERAVQARWG
eukprot:COSAG01_NODE_1005_length_12174_cov_40.917267_3_plen_93_part_00